MGPDNDERVSGPSRQSAKNPHLDEEEEDKRRRGERHGDGEENNGPEYAARAVPPDPKGSVFRIQKWDKAIGKP